MKTPQPPLAPPAPAAARDRRAGRGRIIVLGDQAVIESVAGATHRPTTLARHMYDVIGELVQAGVLDGPDAVIASLEALGAKSDAFVKAVRRIDPGVELIAISDHAGGTASEASGFDAMLTMPLDGDQLESVVSGGLPTAAERSKGDASATHAPTPAPREIAAEHPAPVDHRPAPSSSTDRPMPAAAPSPGGALGDVDLVAAILQEPERAPQLALRLIEQETGWRGLRIDETPSSTAPSAEVIAPASGKTEQRLRLGRLTCSPQRSGHGPAAPGAAELQPWADWLAHWLLLARTVDDLRRQAMTDQLTGAYNRRFFDDYLTRAIDEARDRRQCVSLLLFDIDDFKVYNDRYGHAAGDEILVETVRLLRSVIRPNDRVCRIGGDEFVVIFHDPQGQRERGSSHPEDIQQIARRFQQQICRHRFPKLSAEAPGTLTISGGLATYPWDGADVPSLLEQADRNAMASKRAGKNAITFGPGVDDVCTGDGGVADSRPGT